MLPHRRQHLVDALHRCENIDDYFLFAQTHLPGGTMQLQKEIGEAISYMSQKPVDCICEIGTAGGGTNLLLSHLIPSVKVVIGIDLHVMNASRLRLLRRHKQEMYFVNGSSYSHSTFEQVRKYLNGRKIDVLLIDGDHRYEGVLSDFLLYRELVREDGMILFHDIVPDHSTVYGRSTGSWAGDVPDFWRQISTHYPHQVFVENEKQDGLGIGLIHYSAAVQADDIWFRNQL